MNKKDINDVSRQRIAQIRLCILRDLIVWTVQGPWRLTAFPALWQTFHWLVYPGEQKFKDGKKLCIQCERLGRQCWHPLEDFYEHERLRGGVHTYCKQCVSENNMAYAREHKDKVAAYSRKYKRSHVENFRKYSNKYYHRHKAKRLAYIQKWRNNNKERYDAYQKAYRERKKAEGTR